MTVLEDKVEVMNENEEKEITLKTGQEVADYLKSLGYKVGKSKVYMDIDEGLLRRDKNGVFTLKEVMNYAKKFLVKIDGSDKPKRKIGTLTDVKMLQAEILELKKQMMQQQLEVESGRYLKKDEVYSMLAQRAARFKSDLFSLVYKTVPEICSLVGGDSKKVGDGIVFLKNEINKILKTYAES